MGSIRAFALAAVACIVCLSGCAVQYPGERMEYGAAPAPAAVVPAHGGKLIEVPASDATRELVLEYKPETIIRGQGRLGYFFLRFDLSGLPAGSHVLGGRVRLRKAASHAAVRQLRLNVVNVNRGLRVKKSSITYDDDDRATRHRIISYEETGDEGLMWKAADDGGPPGLELAHYAVRRRGGLTYLDLLSGDWNPSEERLVEKAEPWDAVDVAEFVRAELAGDRSLTLLFAPAREDSYFVSWRHPKEGPATAPRLVVEYSIGGPPAPPASPAGAGTGVTVGRRRHPPIAARLRELRELRDEGLITDDEYKAKKKSILEEL